MKVPDAKLWTPEEPNLYVLETSTGGDSTSTRFGMREFRFDTAPPRIPERQSPISCAAPTSRCTAFSRIPQSGTLPWNESGSRKLLVDIPKQMHWNSFRFCIGPVPDKWLEIADEAGLLIQNEYFMWTGQSWPGWQRGGVDAADDLRVQGMDAR